MAENIDLMVKLFETLKQSSDKNEATLQKLIEQQHSLIGHIEYLPIKELQTSLKDHNKESSDEITSCTDTVNKTSDSILERVKKIDGKVGKMITIVLVAFSLLTITFIVAKMTMDTGLMDKKIQTYLSVNQRTDHDAIVKSVRETMKSDHDAMIKAVTEAMTKEFQKIDKRISSHHGSDKEDEVDERKFQ
jgi:hypothetical protein